MHCIDVVEGKDFTLEGNQPEQLRVAVERLRVQLNPSFSLMSERAGTFRLTNVVGTIDLGAGLMIQVTPKVDGMEDWVTAVIALLTGKEGIDVAGERQAGFSKSHNRLLDAIARTYLRRLERAFRQEGPIVLMERRSVELPSLNGKLDVTRWARMALWRPHVFPVVRTEFAQDNPFTRGFVHVAGLLAQVSTDPKTRSGLRTSARDLSVGIPMNAPPPNGIGNRSLPEQWNAYKPAWSLAMAVLSKTSLFGPTGGHAGVGLAIEAWPLLETLLERTLQAVQRVGRAKGRTLSYQVQGEVPLLIPRGGMHQEPFSPKPDGRLFENGQLIATFEAKYSPFAGSIPKREHIYQALTTAAACGAEISILVYPETFEPKMWDVIGLSGQPVVLVVVGLGLYKWLPPNETEARAEKLLEFVDRLKVPALNPNLVVAG